jgi:fructoselysine-6-P-deglycase FrlB-like protein
MMRARFAHERARVEAGLADYHVEAEIDSQPSCWREAVSRLPGVREALPRDGESVAVFGCGTSLYMARAYAGLRESRGLGVTDAFAASELPFGRRYDRHVAISRSGTTTEVLQAVERLSEDTGTAEITARLWTESYPAMEYRHGPISIAEPGRMTWVFGPAPEGLAEDVAATGATYVTSDLDPMAHLIVAQRLAVAQARAKGMDPDRPRSLTRSVVLS